MLKRFLVVVLLLVATASSALAFEPIELGDGKFLKIFYDTQFGYTFRSVGSGENYASPTNTFNFRRNRLGLIGTYNESLSFYFQMEYIDERLVYPLYVAQVASGSNFYVLDAQVRYDAFDWLKIYVGKLKYNLTRENLEACFEPLTFDRSLFMAAPYKTSRDLGFAIWGNFAKDYLQYRVDVMAGHLPTSGSPTPASNFRYTARLNVNLLDPELTYGVAGTYLGKKKVLTIGGAYQIQPDTAYSDVADRRGRVTYQAYSFDIFFEYPTDAGTFTASAAYLNTSFDNAYKGLDPDAGTYGINGQKNGYYAKVGYMLPVNVWVGQLQFFARYDNFKFANLYNPTTSTNFYDQNLQYIGAGLNYYISGQNIKLVVQYSKTLFDKKDPKDANYGNFDTVEVFTQFRF